MGVEQTMCFVTVGGILKVQFVDRGDLIDVLIGTQLEACVVTIEAGGTHRDDFVGHEHVGLTRAIEAARSSVALRSGQIPIGRGMYHTH